MTRAWPRRSPDLGPGYDVPAEALRSALEDWISGPRPQTWDQFATWAESVRGRRSDTVRVSIWAGTYEAQMAEMLEETRRRVAPTDAEMVRGEVDPIEALLARVRGAA